MATLRVPGYAQRLAAGGLLVAAGLVLVAAPYVVGDPNPLSLPAAAVPLLAGGLLIRSSRGVGFALAVGSFGTLLSATWLWLAADGFGKGVPWLDDIVEAALLTALFLGSVVVLLMIRGRT